MQFVREPEPQPS